MVIIVQSVKTFQFIPCLNLLATVNAPIRCVVLFMYLCPISIIY